MKVLFFVIQCCLPLWWSAQVLSLETLYSDDISIRAIEIDGDRVWYAGIGSKMGYVGWKNPTDRLQITLPVEGLEFRTLARRGDRFHAVSVGAPAYWFTLDKRTLKAELLEKDTVSTVFYDAFVFRGKRGVALSDPRKGGVPHVVFVGAKGKKAEACRIPFYSDGEAHFAASNTNVAMWGRKVWAVSGGHKARVFRFRWGKPCDWEVAETDFVQGSSSQGIYSVDFYRGRFGVAVGGDYTRQQANVNNIATSWDGGRTWQIQASGQNVGYMTCVRLRPGSKGREMVAVGDRHISYSGDYGRTWVKLSDERDLYTFRWVDADHLVFAGKNKIVRGKLAGWEKLRGYAGVRE
ncbi:glycosyl hydrolase [Bergeyella sp. RCAD1439]|uniref:glycosyl hydrolase n=1 Tax=Bergeyella anatis TaxID=3113737 RepID=UPI002E18FE93|nr:glycosyl hydrolase [Bergeyella sp. RCAD1439]